MQAALKALNRLVADGVVENYAIGGAIGASFYIDALQTEDIDAFVILPVAVSGLVSLTPVYQALLAQGGVEEREYVRFGDWPLQILTDANSLIAEAISQAKPVQFEGVATRVFSAEHICAIALQAGRRKDYLRVTMFLDQERVDLIELRTLAELYSLTAQLDKAMRESEGGDA